MTLKAASETSSFRTHGTWTRKLIPDSVEVSQGTYELPPLNVKGIASDLVTILMAVGTTCLAVAVYGACSSRRSKKWDSVYDGAMVICIGARTRVCCACGMWCVGRAVSRRCVRVCVYLFYFV